METHFKSPAAIHIDTLCDPRSFYLHYTTPVEGVQIIQTYHNFSDEVTEFQRGKETVIPDGDLGVELLAPGH